MKRLHVVAVIVAPAIVVVTCLLVFVIAVVLPHWRQIVVEMNSVNPMLLGFLVEFAVDNHSGEDVQVLPIGVTEGYDYAALPQFTSPDPPTYPRDFWVFRDIRAGASLRVIYDYDDINFRHLLIRDRNGQLYLLDTDPRRLTCCYPAMRDVYVIPALSEIPLAPPELLPLLEREAVPSDAIAEP